MAVSTIAAGLIIIAGSLLVNLVEKDYEDEIEVFENSTENG